MVGGDGVRGVALGVLDNELEHPTVDAARGVDLVRSHLLGLVRDRAVRLTGTRQRLHHADPERLVLLAVITAGDDSQHKDGRQAEDEEQLTHGVAQEGTSEVPV